MPSSKPLRLNFPIFSIICHKTFIIVSGGGGRKEYGIENKLAVYKSTSQLKDLVVEVATKQDLIENLNSNGKTDLISCNSGRFCIIYKIHPEKGDVEEETRFPTDVDGQNTSVFDSKGTILVTGGEDSIIKIWKIGTEGGKTTATKELDLRSHTAPVNHLSISADDTLLVSSSDDRTCRVFDLKTGSLVKRLTFGEEGQRSNLKFACAYFSLNHHFLYTIQNSFGDGPAYFTVWSMGEDFKPERTLKIHNHAITSSCVNEQGSYMGLGTVDGCSKILSIKNLDINCQVTAHELIVKSVNFINKSRALISVSADYSFYFLPNVRSTKWFTLILRLWLFALLFGALLMFFHEKYKILDMVDYSL